MKETAFSQVHNPLGEAKKKKKNTFMVQSYVFVLVKKDRNKLSSFQAWFLVE
jgi:hypothetical protein